MNETDKKQPAIEIPVYVDKHTTTEKAKKADTYKVTFKAIDGAFYVGMDKAKATLEIETEDDIVQHTFPLNAEFRVKVFPMVVSKHEKKPVSEPTTLDDHSAEESLTVEDEAEEETEDEVGLEEDD